MSVATKFTNNFNTGSYRENRCFVTLKNKVKEAAASSGPWGEDVMYWFSDGSMLLERVIVKEFQLFKG